MNKLSTEDRLQFVAILTAFAEIGVVVSIVPHTLRGGEIYRYSIRLRKDYGGCSKENTFIRPTLKEVAQALLANWERDYKELNDR